MKNKIVPVIILYLLLMTGCSAPNYLPNSQTIDVNEYGSYIEINPMSKSIGGELLAVDSNALIVLADNNLQKKVMVIPLNKVRNFTLRYAKSKNYGWAIPLYTLATISHGVLLLITAPINLITTISVATGSNNAFVYRKQEITYDELKMFARFPQGIPQGVDLSMIK